MRMNDTAASAEGVTVLKDQIAKIKDMSEGLKGVAKATSRELARLYEGGERIGNKS